VISPTSNSPNMLITKMIICFIDHLQTYTSTVAKKSENSPTDVKVVELTLNLLPATLQVQDINKFVTKPSNSSNHISCELTSNYVHWYQGECLCAHLLLEQPEHNVKLVSQVQNLWMYMVKEMGRKRERDLGCVDKWWCIQACNLILAP
jgi:hypothetical protein